MHLVETGCYHEDVDLNDIKIRKLQNKIMCKLETLKSC